MEKSTPTSAELPSTAFCPCNSGLRYGQCCKLKDFKWMKDEDGELSQIIPISPQLGRVIESTKSRFKRIFGREPRGRDPMFVEKYLVSQRDYQREMMDAMLKARISPEIMYAYRKTGRLLTKKNSRLLPENEIAKWHSAIEEYRKLKGTRFREPRVVVELRSLVGELDACIVMLGYLLEHGVSRRKRSRRIGRFSIREYSIFCAVRCFSALRSIDLMLEKERGADAMPLIRAIYESYLHMRFLEQHPSKLRDLVDARLGIEIGTHSFAKNAKGVPDRRTIIDNKTGEQFEGHISMYRMAESSRVANDKLLFPYLYEYLSGFVHPSIRYIPDYAAHDNSLDSAHDERLFEVTCYAITVACMALDYFRESRVASAPVMVDLSRVLGRIAKRVLRILRREAKANSGPLDKQLLQRWEDIARANP